MVKKKIFKNTPKGRLEIPEKAGKFRLLDGHGNNILDGWRCTKNLRNRIKECHYDKTKQFKYIEVWRGK